ncbi:MAG: ArgE/DapE family deacylase [Sumerlaeia bacterium]
MNHLPPDFPQALSARRDWAISNLARLTEEPTLLGNEASGQDVVAELYEAVGLDVEMIDVDPDVLASKPGWSPVDWSYEGRPCVAGTHEPGGSPEGRSLVFNSHIDVVSPEPVQLWTTHPFEAEIFDGEDGRPWMRGRGAGDMKAGTLAYLWALGALRDAGLEPASKVICQSPIEEECTGNGALALCEAGYLGDACLIPEPFAETILTAQVGVLWFDVTVLGRTTHVLGAGRGVNAIEKTFPIITALRALEEEINASIPALYEGIEHPINLNVGIIDGGDWGSTVAGECTTRFRLGLFPGEKIPDLKRRVEQRVAEVAAADPWLKNFPPTVNYVGFHAEGCTFDGASDFGRDLAAIHRDLRGSAAAELRCTATTDVRFFNLYYDVPATCYGPIAKDIHGVDECVSLDSMSRVAEVMAHLIARWCGVRKRG